MDDKSTDEIMHLRRLERLENLTFFMTDIRAPKTQVIALSAAHNLLTGWFENSCWRTAWWCVGKAFSNSWMTFTVHSRLWYYEKILRLNEEQIDERFCK